MEAHGHAGDTLALENCRKVGNVMARIAIGRNIFADRVIVIDPQSGRKLAAEENTVPLVQFILINEEDAVADFHSTCLNLRFHAKEGDDVGCLRLLERLNTLDIEDASEIAESILCNVNFDRDAEWRTSIKTLMHIGVSGVPAFQVAVKLGFVDVVAFLLSTEPALVEVEYDVRDRP